MIAGPTAPRLEQYKDDEEYIDRDDSLSLDGEPMEKTQVMLESLFSPRSSAVSADSSSSCRELCFLQNGKAIKESSKLSWTETQIEETMKQMMEQKRDLLIEQETSKVRLEMKRIQKASTLLKEEVSSTKRVVENYEKDKEDRSKEIAELRREILVLKQLLAANETRFRYPDNQELIIHKGKDVDVIGNKTKTNFISGIKRSIFAQKDALTTKARHSQLSTLPASTKKPRSCSKQTVNLHRFCSMQSEFSVSGGAEIVSLKMKIDALEEEKRIWENKVKKLESKVERVSNILENLLAGLSERAGSAEDRSLLKSLKDTVETGKESNFCLKGEKEHHDGSDLLSSPSTLTGVIPGVVIRESGNNADQFIHGSNRSYNRDCVPCSEDVSYLFQARENKQNMVNNVYTSFTEFKLTEIEKGPVSFLL